MSSHDSLTDLMNRMIARIESTHPDEMSEIPESKYWDMIGIYIAVDPVLATLYKQYCDAKDNLGKLLVENGDQDPMTEIAWDMHDSLRSAIETRLLELKDDDAVTERIASIIAHRATTRSVKPSGRKTQNQSLNDMMAFMMMASMAMQAARPTHNVRRDFARAH